MMFNKYSTRWTRLAIKAIVPAVLLVLIATQVLADSSCKKVKGKFTLQPVTGPACASSVGICANGTFSGDFAGTSTFVGSSLIQSVDTPSTSVVFLTGDTTIATNSGNLLTKDAIALTTTSNGEFAEVDTIIGGTGDWADVTGRFTATGTFNITTGGAGIYSGEVCAP
jgi:hypothetical protein